MFKIDFEFMNEFNSELISQQLIFNYIESNFFDGFNDIANILGLPNKDGEKIFSNNQIFIKDIIEKTENYIEANKLSDLKYLEVPKWIKGIDQREPLGEIINTAIEGFENGENKDEIILKFKQSIKEAKKYDNYHNYLIKDIEKCVDAGFVLYKNKGFYEIEKNINYLDKFRSVIRLLDVKQASNIYRQSFINIVSIFDALVFDKLKKYFIHNIDKLNEFFRLSVNKSKIEIQDIIRFKSIDELNLYLVNLKFEQIYLSKIFQLLKNYDDTFFENNEFEQLQEIINIRNIHIHNKGIVDSKFLEERYNLRKFNLGVTAIIDKSYLIRVFNLLSSVYEKIEKTFSC